jgi:undecaprenyl-diphosphatase
MSLFITDHKILHFDSKVISFIQGMESPTLTSVMKFFTFIGSAPFVIFMSIVILFFLYKVLHHRMELILFILTIVGSAALNGLLKHHHVFIMASYSKKMGKNSSYTI